MIRKLLGFDPRPARRFGVQLYRERTHRDKYLTEQKLKFKFNVVFFMLLLLNYVKGNRGLKYNADLRKILNLRSHGISVISERVCQGQY